jgi:hypothetical protein
MTEPTTAPILKLLGALLPGAVGSAIALRFNTADASSRDRALAFFAGVALGHYGGSALAHLYGLDGPMADALRVAIGLFGLALVANVMAEIPALIAAARRRYLGDPPQ